MKAFDFDGVVSIGIMPGPEDVIVTGRSYSESAFVDRYLAARGISVPVYYYPSPEIRGHSRASSAHWKAKVLSILKPKIFFENDPDQIAILRTTTDTEIVLVNETMTSL